MGWGKRAPRRRDPIRAARSTRSDEQFADEMFKAAAKMAPTLGFCGFCGAGVDEENPDPAKRWLHAPDCSAVPAERKRAS